MLESDSHASSVNESMFTAGRTFHHVENSAYWFPNDDEEMDRLIGVRRLYVITCLVFKYDSILLATLCPQNIIWRVIHS